MNRKIGLTILFVLLLSCVSLYNNCGNVLFSGGHVYETAIGNPKNPTQASQEILFAICSVLDRCQGQVPFNVCMSGIGGVNGMGARLGLPQGSYDPFSTLENAESSSVISANMSQANNCVDTINNLSCSDPDVQNAYNSSSPNPFAAASFMVPISACGQVFTPPVQSYACSTKVFLRGSANTPNGPAISGTGLTYSITPSLPAGLILDPGTGIISGTPTVVTAMTAYTVTATGLTGSTTSPLNMRTADGYLVNNLLDLHNIGPGCTDSSGQCSLRAAIEEVNSSPSSNVILLPPGQINLVLGSELSVTKSMDIYGDCAGNTVVDGQGTSRVFHFQSGPSSLQNVVVQNGKDSVFGGAGIFVDGTNGSFTLNLQNLIVQNNTYTGSGGWFGGGIRAANNGNLITLNLNQCVIQNNSSIVGGGGITMDGVTTMSNCIVQNNTANNGAGIVCGGIDTVSQSLISNNTATSSVGGGIYCNSGGGGADKINLTNDTIAGNTATRGGGVESGNSGSIVIINSSITNNIATNGSYGGGIDSANGGTTIQISNSIVAANKSAGAFLNCRSSLILSQGNNLSDDGSCGLNSAGDLQNKNPLLGPLQNNGGFTMTEGLLPGSPAIDSGNAMLCPGIDQRGAARHLPATCDIGAYEHQP